MKQFDDLNHANNLPDYYKKSEASNNYKILAVEKFPIDNFETDLSNVFKSLDLDSANGKTLDLYGEMLEQPRGTATDEQYILMIRSKIMRNLSGGDYPSVLNAICNTFKCEPSQVCIVEKDDPCTVELVVMPLDIINKAGMTTKQTVAMIQRLLPVGITLESYLFEGTFSFSNSETEYNETAGFCDIEGGTIGGFFGILYGEDNEPILPI